MVLVKFAFEKLRLSKAAAMFTVSSVMRYMLATIQAKSLKLRLKASVCYQSLSLRASNATKHMYCESDRAWILFFSIMLRLCLWLTGACLFSPENKFQSIWSAQWKQNMWEFARYLHKNWMVEGNRNTFLIWAQENESHSQKAILITGIVEISYLFSTVLVST